MNQGADFGASRRRYRLAWGWLESDRGRLGRREGWAGAGAASLPGPGRWRFRQPCGAGAGGGRFRLRRGQQAGHALRQGVTPGVKNGRRAGALFPVRVSAGRAQGVRQRSADGSEVTDVGGFGVVEAALLVFGQGRFIVGQGSPWDMFTGQAQGTVFGGLVGQSSGSFSATGDVQDAVPVDVLPEGDARGEAFPDGHAIAVEVV